MKAEVVEIEIVKALSFANIGSLPHDAHFAAADRILSMLKHSGRIASYGLRITESPGVRRTIIVAWSANLQCPTRELSLPVADLTKDHWEVASVMDS